MKTRKGAQRQVVLYDDPTWYKDAIIYEVHVRAFKDSNTDGIGDLNGLTESLDYLQDLGVTAIWILPFYPSPLRDGGYDIADYTNIHPAYGTLRDFRRLIYEAHRRGLRVITELVINHTSNEHSWFQRARRAKPGTAWRNFYVWSDDQARYSDARIIFKDFETSNWAWDPVAKSYYWHRFYSHQPDLNFDNPLVRESVLAVLDSWMELGVDGMRLDAVPYLFERDGTNCENLPETHTFLKELRAHIDAKWSGRMLLAEANQWPIDAAAYFGRGDECHMNFHFPLMPRMFMAVELEDSFPIVNILGQTPKLAPSCQWATFLRNHDELTLEMVTDEDRDYMVHAYAQDRNARINLGIRRRLAPLLEVRTKIELMNGLLMSLPGTPVLYYGDEIGMGDNIYLGDRDGVRTPMQWSANANAGFSQAKPQQLYLPVIVDAEYHYQSVNVEAQQGNTSSLLWWMKRVIALRKQFKVFGRGEIEFLHPDNGRVIAFLREYEGTTVLVVGNLSRFAQFVELDLSRFRGRTPIELWGRTRFPTIGEMPYVLSLGPHGFFWFLLEAFGKRTLVAGELQTFRTRRSWLSLFDAEHRSDVARTLADYFVKQRLGEDRAGVIESATISDVFRIADPRQAVSWSGSHLYAALMLRVEYAEGAAETYFVPVGFASGTRADELAKQAPTNIVARVVLRHGDAADEAISGVIYDALAVSGLPEVILKGIASRRTFEGERGKLVGSALKLLKADPTCGDLATRFIGGDQNTVVVHGDRFVSKFFRLIEEGPSVETEVGRYFQQFVGKVRVPNLAGTFEYRAAGLDSITLGIVQQYVANWGDAYQLMLDALDRYFDRILAEDTQGRTAPRLPRSPLESVDDRTKAQLFELMGSHYDRVARLAVRTGELHLVLGRGQDDPAFAPEAFTPMYQQSLYQSVQNMMARTSGVMRRRLPTFNERERALAAAVIAQEQAITARLATITQRKIVVDRIRCHGDFHLRQVLWTGDDFVIIDFEGDRSRPVAERRYKRCALRDIAWMLHSFHDAARAMLRSGRTRPDDQWKLEAWSEASIRMVSTDYVRTYLDTVGAASFVPSVKADVDLLLDFYRMEKCILEVANGLQNRPQNRPQNRSEQFEFALRDLLAMMDPNG